jgi:cyclopropane fatty-acyl-phospholipid synthase-like methyltransferase
MHHVEDVLEKAARSVGYSNVFRYRARANSLFSGVPLSGAEVLEIGCGTGAWAIWAALHGAARVVGIEPGAAGSGSNTLERFRQTIKSLGLDKKIEATDHYLQQLPLRSRLFDIVVMYNVINHLDEEAVTILHQYPFAFDRYVALLTDLRARMSQDGWLIAADCARSNLWHWLNLPSPFARSIEWHKHQNPDQWVNVFERAGFRYVDLHWSPLQPFPRLTSNWFVQFMTCSHFVLRFR